MELIEIAPKAGKVIRSAATPDQVESAEKFKKLYHAFMNREELKTHPWSDFWILFLWAGLAFIGVMSILYAASLGVID